MSASPLSLDGLRFVRRYGELPETFYTRLAPTPFERPFLVHFNPDAADLIDLDPADAQRPDFADFFCGKRQLPGSDPLAAVYAGHQFGYYVPQLGDGRAILLGEARNARDEVWDIELKGSGKTPYSRMGDGRAVLRSTLREYLCSEAMHHLGIPTTRALCIVGSDEDVAREQWEKAAMVTRLSPSHVRFGTFQFFAHTRRNPQELKTLADYVLRHHYPHCLEDEKPMARFFEEVIGRTARLMAQWQAVGFNHGVMNTDNFSILGITLDYGPFGFMEAFDPGFVCNHSDTGGRYSYENQPAVGLWNLNALGNALVPLLDEADIVLALQNYQSLFTESLLGLMRDKLGLAVPMREDADLINDTLRLMAEEKLDMTIFFRSLSMFSVDGDEAPEIREQFLIKNRYDAWAERYRTRLQAENSQDAPRQMAMNRVNPKFVLRNWLAEQAIRKAEDEADYSELDRLWRVLRRPFDEQPEYARYAESAPDWARHLTVSCSS
jgi:uncharacterized protein YdiU (UPF0061 family)